MKDCERRVEAVNAFREDDKQALGDHDRIPLDGLYNGASFSLRRQLHRDIILGNGFFKALMEPAPGNVTESLANVQLGAVNPRQPRRLPSVNFLAGLSEENIDALVQEALPSDRVRFRQYLSDRPAGISIITGVSHIAYNKYIAVY